MIENLSRTDTLKSIGKGVVVLFQYLANCVRYTIEKIRTVFLFIEAYIAAKIRRTVKDTAAYAYIDTSIKIMIVVVIGCLVLVGCVALIRFVILPNLAETVDGVFAGSDEAASQLEGQFIID